MKKCLFKRLRYLKDEWYSRGYLRGKASGFQLGFQNRIGRGSNIISPVSTYDMEGRSLIINPVKIVSGPVKPINTSKDVAPHNNNIDIPNFNNSSINPNYYADANGDSDLLHHVEKIFPAEQVRGFYRLVILKYLKRYPKKNGVEDLRKAETYLKRLINMESD